MRYGLKGILLAVGAIVTCTCIGIYFFFINQSKPLAGSGNESIADVETIFDETDLNMYTKERINGAQVALAVEKFRAKYDVVVQINTEDKQIDYDFVDASDSGVKLKFTKDVSTSADLDAHLNWNSSEWINPTAQFQGRLVDYTSSTGSPDGKYDTVVFTQMTPYEAPDFTASEPLADVTEPVTNLQKALTNLKLQIETFTEFYPSWKSVSANVATNAETAYTNYSALLEKTVEKDSSGKLTMSSKFKDDSGSFPWETRVLSGYTMGVSATDNFDMFISLLLVDYSDVSNAVPFSQIKSLSEEEMANYYFLKFNVAMKCSQDAYDYGWLTDDTTCYYASKLAGDIQLTGRYQSFDQWGERITEYCNVPTTSNRTSTIVTKSYDIIQSDADQVVFTNLYELFKDVENNITYAENIITHLDKDNDSFEREKSAAIDYLNKATQAATLIENSVNIETVDAVSSNYAYTQTLVQAGNVLNDPMYFNTELIDMLEIYIDDPDYENLDGYDEVSNLVSAAQDFNDSVEDMQSLYADFNAELSVLVGNATSSSASLITLLKEEIAAMITTVNDLK